MYIPVVIHKETGSDYGVTVPDIPGCFSSGESFTEALKSIKEAILFHIEMLLDDDIIPDLKFRNLDDLASEEEYEGGIFAVVDVDLDDLTLEKSRFNVSWPKYLLTILDGTLKQSHETRSGYLAKLVLRDIKSNNFEGI